MNAMDMIAAAKARRVIAAERLADAARKALADAVADDMDPWFADLIAALAEWDATQ